MCALIYVRLLYSSLVDLTDDEQAHREIRSDINSIRLCISWTGLHHDQFTFYVYQESGGTKHGVPADAREFHI